MAVRDDFAPGEVLAAADLNDTFASKLAAADQTVIQIVRATDTTTRNTTSTSYVDAGISVTITPEKSDSAIVLIWSFSSAHAGSAAVNTFTITDASDNVISNLNAVSGSSLTTSFGAANTLIAYATPATTSATTYKGRFRTSAGTGVIENAANTGQLYAIEVSA